MSAARSCCSLNALLTVACVAVVESGRDGTGRDREEGEKGMGHRHAGYIDCSNRLKVLPLSICRAARLQQ